MLNYGACALSFVPGLLYDKLGATKAMVIGTCVGTIRLSTSLKQHWHVWTVRSFLSGRGRRCFANSTAAELVMARWFCRRSYRQ